MKLISLALILPVVGLAAAYSTGSAPRNLEDEKIAPLFTAKTPLEPATIVETKEALITRFSDRVRDRHAREGNFKAYDHFLPLYWEKRTVDIEIVDRMAKGGDSITYNFTSLAPLNEPNLRLFFEGKGTVAQYSCNLICKQIDPLHYTVTVKTNTNERRPIKIGDQIEMEFSPFLLPPVTGRTNYYGTAFLYVVGKGGVAPWETRAESLDSFPIPAEGLSGGATTLHRQYSNEPRELFKQLVTNAAPGNAQRFVIGRRVHHTDFGSGLHSESGNPEYPEVKGLLGKQFSEKSCSGCHVNNGRALPAEPGKSLTSYLVKVAADEKGTPHPTLGSVIPAQSTEALASSIRLEKWEEIAGSFPDGESYSLRRPVYRFTGTEPKFYSVRIAPPLVGMGLLEAISEERVLGGKSGSARVRSSVDDENGTVRLGRFGWKAGQPSVRQQLAAALKNDMGVATDLYPVLDPKVASTGRRLGKAEFENLYRYNVLLGVPPRRNLSDPGVLRGEKLFKEANCSSCHTPLQRTSAYHPLAELRNQTIFPYTDLLLHDMGAGLADSLGEGNATGKEWRTTPLWGVGLTASVSGGQSYLHDGRARTLVEAILWHGGEATESVDRFRRMSKTDRANLLKFLGSL